MDRRVVAQKPAHMLGSVDNTLRLLQGLRDTGAMRITDAAEELGVSVSTAHRLLSMLVYRGFAVRDESRVYHPGPGIVAGAQAQSAHRGVLERMKPRLKALSEQTGQTCNLMVRVGTTTRFLDSCEGPDGLGIGSRAGEILPAALTSGGQVLLADLGEDVLENLYRSKSARTAGDHLDEAAFAKFVRRLETVRRAGWALNRERTERGVAALGMAVRDPAGVAVAAVSISVPSDRASLLNSSEIHVALARTCRAD